MSTDWEEKTFLLLTEKGFPQESGKILGLLESELTIAASASRERTFSKHALAVGTRLPDSYNPVNPEVVRFAREESSRLVTNITESTRRGIAATIAQSLEQMEGVTGRRRELKAKLITDKISGQMKVTAGLDSVRAKRTLSYQEKLREVGYKPEDVERLTAKFSNKMLNERAKTISQTEMRQAVETETMKAEMDSGATHKEWLTVGDNRVSPQDAANEAQGLIPIKDKFQSGHDAPPGHPNCRCTLAFSNGEFEKLAARLKAEKVIAEAPIVEAEVPAAVEKKVEKKGIEALTKEERAAMPLEELEKLAQPEIDKIGKKITAVLEDESMKAYDSVVKKYREAQELLEKTPYPKHTGADYIEKAKKYSAAYGEYSAAQKEWSALLEKNRGTFAEVLSYGDVALKNKFVPVTKSGKKAVQSECVTKGASFYKRIADGSNIPETFEVGYITGRAYSNGINKISIHVKKTGPAATVCHELGHNLDGLSPVVKQKVLQWRDRRTVGDKVERLKDIKPNSGYGNNEVTKKDKFKNPYTGKIYKSGHTEVCSMGVERLYADPIDFFREDPDHFRVTIMALRGWL